MNQLPAVVPPARSGVGVQYALIELAKRYPDCVRLGRGDPDFDTPAHITDAVRRSLSEADRLPISPPEGLLELRTLIAGRLQKVNGILADPGSEIIVTEGGQEALFLMVRAALGPDDEIVVPDPTYYTYQDAIALTGARKVSVMTFVEEDFDISPDRVRAAITKKTRALLLVSPNSPTASVPSPARVRQLAAIAEEHDLLILADETYDQFLFDAAIHTSPASIPGIKDRTLTINTFSKTYSMTGWRLGWVAGPASMMLLLRRLKEAVSAGTSVVSQQAGIAALTGPQDAVREMQEAYVRRRRVVLDTLDRIKLRYGTPLGGHFVFVDIRETGLPSVDFAHRLLEEEHVLVSPGSVFGEAGEGFVRIAFLQPEAVLDEGMRRMEKFVGRYSPV